MNGLPIPTMLRNDAKLAAVYEKRTTDRVAAQHAYFRARGVSHCRITTVEDVVPTLLRLLQRAQAPPCRILMISSRPSGTTGGGGSCCRSSSRCWSRSCCSASASPGCAGWRRRGSGGPVTPKVLPLPVDVRRKALTRIASVEQRVTAGELTPREAHIELSGILRELAYYTTRFDARTMTLTDLRRAGLTRLADTLAGSTR